MNKRGPSAKTYLLVGYYNYLRPTYDTDCRILIIVIDKGCACTLWKIKSEITKEVPNGSGMACAASFH